MLLPRANAVKVHKVLRLCITVDVLPNDYFFTKYQRKNSSG